MVKLKRNLCIAIGKDPFVWQRMNPIFKWLCSIRFLWSIQGTEGSTRRWKCTKAADSQVWQALWLGIVWYYAQGNSTCLSRKSIAHIVRKLHEVYLLDKGSLSGLAFYIDIGTHWKYHKLLRSMNLLETIPFVLQNTARVHFEVVHGYSFHTERPSRK